ncbi:general transcription factor IIH subunit 3 [Galendromus occidentalis]|uniref:General transcription factor IIH subunit 3 n=1 Tax=Galendromus occidentalis TaxID=34638 RepID=A0AAJ6QNG1_9ACAR|nr:general transcription factor IIH subunit 3 [Galendromus occidentalis]
MGSQIQPEEEDEVSELLAVVLDTSFNSALIKEKNVGQLLDAVVIFSNAHLMNSSKNTLAVVACHPHTAKMIYPVKKDSIQNIRPPDAQMEILAHATQVIRDGIKEVVTSWQGVYSIEPLLTGGMALALCYIAKRMANTVGKLNGRILVLSSSGESAHQYLNFMNVFFAAQRKAIVVDSCVIQNDCGLLQQGADITGGNYLKAPSIAGLLEYLLWVFLPPKSLRAKLVLPKPDVVDYRTACFCHRNLIEVGYVCSVCLSIFCQFAPICSTCQTHFKFIGFKQSMVKKKEQKSLQAPLL